MGGGLGGVYRVSTEFVIFARRGSLRQLSSVRGTWFNWKRPYNAQGKPKHSAKPPAFFDQVEAVNPGPRLELFARESGRAGRHGVTKSTATLRSSRSALVQVWTL
jgi:N6-adenosine-specific RNA methylase IME4